MAKFPKSPLIKGEVLIEYQKAQDSAEHYNTMIWTLISIGIGFSLLILKFAIFDLNQINNISPTIVNIPTFRSLLMFLGVLSIFYFGFLIHGANQKKKFKYYICKKIELENKNFIGQNLGTKHLPFTKSELGIKIFNFIEGIFILVFFIYSFIFLFNSQTQTDFLLNFILFLAIFLVIIFYLVFYIRMKPISEEEVIAKIEEERKRKGVV